MKNKIVLFITIIVCFLLQCTIMDYISIGSITPNLPLILCVAMGLMRGRKVGLWTGFFSGLFNKVQEGVSTATIGVIISMTGNFFYALIYMYAGYISGYAFRSFYDDDLKVPLFLVAGTDLLYNLSVYGLQFLLRGRLGFLTYIYRIIIPEIVYTVFLTIIVYRIFYWINYHLMDTVRKESESIWELK